MYDINDNKSAILALQTLLQELAYADSTLPKQSLDGVFSARTEEAILAFQQREGLALTGIADLETWEAIAVAAQEANTLRMMRRDPAIPSTLPLTIGSIGHSVTVLQSAIGELSEVYDELPALLVTGSYRNGTAYAVSLLQKKYLLPETGITDHATWNRIMQDLATRERLSIEGNQ